MEYELICSRRKTLGMEVKNDGRIIVRAPLRTSQKAIDAFVSAHESWVRRAQKKLASLPKRQKLTEAQIEELYEQAKAVIPQRVAFYATVVGVTYGKITIRKQKTKWGSCSAKGNLNFNCLLMLAPPEVIDSVVVHELCHRKEMNHSRRFYDHVLRVYPQYHTWDKWLKEHGPGIMSSAE